ncbi:MAG: hypothetical protein ABJP45_17655 [Cyclobacteriaceae bacterium]
MKTFKIVALFASTLLFFFSTSAQTIHTADNNPGAVGGVNIHTGATALADAIAAATAGDIIHVVRSSLNYGNTTVDKQLTILGIGLNPDTDGGELSIVSTINIEDPVASGTRISGLNITSLLSLGGTAGNLTNLLIENSRINRIQHASAATTLTNTIIRHNVIGSNQSTPEEKIDLLVGVISGIVIANNVIYSVNFSGNGSINASNGTMIENNMFVGISNGTVFAFENLNGCSVINNIFYGLRPWAGTTFANNTFENNLSFSTGADGFSSSNGNTSTANLTTQDPLFVNVPISVAIDYSTFDPTLDTGSPALGSGTGGTDMGVFGGGSPMTLEGTLIPTIQSIILPTSVVKGDVLPVQIQAKGN